MVENKGPLIKMCGMTREADAVQAFDLGADAVGMLFYAASPRHVDTAQAAAIAAAVAGRGLRVGLFVDADEAEVRDVLARVPLDILQFHGNEPEAWCQAFGLPYWKTLRVRDAATLPTMAAQYPSAAGILLDTWHPTKAGGTGEAFDWSLLDGLDLGHLILAGGLNPDNVARAIARVRPWAVDVCSGVEQSPGVKSPELMKHFIDEVRRV